MPGLLNRKPNRRRDRVRPRNRIRPRLEELESRTAFAVGPAAFPGALAASQLSPSAAPGTTTTAAQQGTFQGPTTNPASAGASPFASQTGAEFGAPFTTGAAAGGTFQPGSALGNSGASPLLGGSTVFNGANPLALGQLGAAASGFTPGGGNLVVVAPPLTTSLGQPLSSASSPVVVVEPQVPILSPATLSPSSLPLGSTAPLGILDPANYLLARGLNPSLNAGNIPSLLLTQTTETVLEAGGNSGGGGDNAPNTGPSGNGIIPIDSGPLPSDGGEIPPQVQGAIRFLSSSRPLSHDTDTQPDHSLTALERALPFFEPQAALQADAPGAAISVDSES